MASEAREPTAWHLECPECEDETVTDSPKVRFCGLCAGDTGRDVSMLRTALYPAAPLRQPGGEVERLREAVAFLASAVKSGEPWTPTCEEVVRRALDWAEEGA